MTNSQITLEKQLADVVTVKEAAKVLSYTPQYVSKLCREGELDAKLLDRTWITTRQAIEAYMAKYHGSKWSRAAKANNSKSNGKGAK